MLTDPLRVEVKQKERCAGVPWDTVASHPADLDLETAAGAAADTPLGFFSGSRNQLVSPHDLSYSAQCEQTILTSI